MSDQKSKKKSGKPESEPRDAIDESADVAAAAVEVERAQERLEAARAKYRETRDQVEEEAAQVCRTTVGDVIDFVVDMTKKRPLPSLLTAGFLGYFLGRLFRR